MKRAVNLLKTYITGTLQVAAEFGACRLVGKRWSSANDFVVVSELDILLRSLAEFPHPISVHGLEQTHR